HRNTTQPLKPIEIKLDMPELPSPEAGPKEELIKDRLVNQARHESTAPLPGGPEPLRLPRMQRTRPADLQPVVAPPRLDSLDQRLPRTFPRPDREAGVEDMVSPSATLPLRQKEERQSSVELFGGTKASEAAVERGLDWLAAHQSVNGSWSLNQFHV